MTFRSLNPHLAADRHRALSLGVALPDRARGAALFADIAGFTPLTTSLAGALGPRRGAEELTRHLNLVYDVLIDEIHRFGGSVVDFSGDAVMCWFDDDHPAGGVTGAGDGARRAVTVALALQEAMAGVADLAVLDGPPVHLALKVAVASGQVRRFAVGDPGIRRIDVLAGDTVARTAHAEQAARQGEVTLDASVIAVLGDDAVVSSWRSGAGGPVAVLASLTRPAPPASWVSAEGGSDAAEWVDHRLRGRDEEASTELRSAVALFARFDGFDFDGDPDAGARLDTYVCWVQGVLVAHDGHLLQVTIGDKGSYLYMAFGAPTAHEDLADRALATALELRAAPSSAAARLSGPPAMGIDQGIARVGAYGGQVRRTYGVLGDAVNLAARLMAAAGPGEILVTPAVRAASRQRLVFDDLGLLTVKGQARPVAVARLIGRPSGTGSIGYGPLVGRAAELSRLTEALADAAGGRGGTVVVEGEPGVGKSHLVDTARRWVADHHEVTWLAAGHDDGRQGSLAPFLPLLRDLFYLELADDDGSRRALLEHGIDSRVDELRVLGTPQAVATADGIDAGRSFLGALLGLRWAGSPFEEHEPDTRLTRSVGAVAGYLCGESLLRPLVIHIRDAHSLDEDSCRLVELLLGSAEEFPICVLMDRRPDDGRLAVKPDRTILLGPLDPEAVAQLVETLLGSPAGIELRAHLLRRTGGNPLFVEQLVVDLHRRGALLADPAGEWSLPAEVRLDLPVTLNAVLLSRLDHLDPAVRRTVAAAAVLGEVFQPEVLAAMGVVPDDEAAAVLAAGEADGVWSRTDDGRCRFRHALLRDAAYGMQLDHQLRGQHLLAARAIVTCRGRAGTAAETARHYAEAGASWRAAADHRRAGALAARTSRLRDAMHHYEAALVQASAAGCGPGVATSLHGATAEVAAALGDHATAVAHLSAGLDVGGPSAGRPSAGSPSAGGLDAGRPSAGSPSAGGLDAGGLSADEEVVWRARRGESLHRLGRTAEAEAEYEAALVALQAAPEVEMASRIYAGLATVHGQLGQLDEALELAELALRFADRDEGKARAHQRLAQIQWRRGEPAESRAHARSALDCCRRTGDRRALAAVRNTLGLALAALGDTDAALVEFRAAVDGFEQTGSEHGLAGALDNLAQLCARTGDEEAAMLHLERAVRILARIGIGPDGVISAMWQGGSW